MIIYIFSFLLMLVQALSYVIFAYAIVNFYVTMKNVEYDHFSYKLRHILYELCSPVFKVVQKILPSHLHSFTVLGSFILLWIVRIIISLIASSLY